MGETLPIHTVAPPRRHTQGTEQAALALQLHTVIHISHSTPRSSCPLSTPFTAVSFPVHYLLGRFVQQLPALTAARHSNNATDMMAAIVAIAAPVFMQLQALPLKANNSAQQHFSSYNDT